MEVNEHYYIEGEVSLNTVRLRRETLGTSPYTGGSDEVDRFKERLISAARLLIPDKDHHYTVPITASVNLRRK